MALCQVAAHLDSLTENDADASCWRCHLITAIRPFSSAVAVISYLWAALEGVWTKTRKAGNPGTQERQTGSREAELTTTPMCQAHLLGVFSV